MNCLIVSATTKEIAPFLKHYRDGNNGKDSDVLITGIGLLTTAYTLAKQVHLKRPDLVIQAGIAGCFDKNFSLGSVVLVKQDTVADLSVMENKRLNTMFDLGLIKSNQHPFKKGWLVNPHKELLKQTGVEMVNGISINHITTSKSMMGLYREKFKPVVESMEGAALHYVCLMEKIPFLQLRAISNYAGERNKKKWNFTDAVTNLNKELLSVIHNVKLSVTSNQ